MKAPYVPKDKYNLMNLVLINLWTMRSNEIKGKKNMNNQRKKA